MICSSLPPFSPLSLADSNLSALLVKQSPVTSCWEEGMEEPCVNSARQGSLGKGLQAPPQKPSGWALASGDFLRPQPCASLTPGAEA